ncbi:otoferlin-like isoform X2 [Bacillus rossius redtenbacheri]|uniref:otoferlin-like isoform X2 n=1 Tax=Bacillus rossius redtenbacheri TaxID=93214 RepID=UPI002FDE8861
MALTLRVRHLQVPAKFRGEKIVKADFRGVSHFSRVLEDTGENIAVEERFEWPVARPVESHEQLQLQLLSRSRYLSNKLLAAYALVLQKVVQDGCVALSDTMLDLNNKPLQAVVSFEVQYAPPDGPAGGPWPDGDDEQQMLVDIEQNIANLERSLSQGRRGSWGQEEEAGGQRGAARVLRRGGSLSAPEKSPAPERKRSSTLKSVKSFMRLGKQRPPRDEEGRPLLEAEPPPLSRSASLVSCSSEESLQSGPPPEDRPRSRRLKSLTPQTGSALKAQDFQLCVTVIEARQLAGLNMDPVVCVQVGDQRKYTSVKESTNCPYYNEYFVFDFHMPPVMLFDKIITLSVLQSRNILRSNKMLGSFKLDVATVWSQPDHQFYHKWALLTDPDDIAGGPKGYLKCDISVIGKGDTIKVPPKSEKDEDDIEANLLLPDGVPVERQRARFIVRVYRADGLPKMNLSIVANVKKAFTGEHRDLVDPYVQVSFAGLSGKTSVKKHSYAPVWNEQLIFTEMFPPLCQRIKIQLRDNDPVNDTVIGTHFIDLKTISNDGEKGFLPTFGPSFVHLYGSTRGYSLLDEHAGLNAGLGEGVSYRARLLLAIRTEVTDCVDLAPCEVELEPTYPVNEASYGKNEEFFLFATVLDATMIDRRLGDKPMFIEISIGNAGNTIDGHNQSVCRDASSSDSEENLAEVVSADAASWQSTTPPIRPMTGDRVYYYLPYWDDKPCMHVRSAWPDYRRRMYNSNIIARILDKLEEGLSEVHGLLELEDPGGEPRLRSVLDELAAGCARYASVAKGNGSSAGVGRTKLDKERAKLCLREVEQIGNMARNLKALVTKHSFKDRYKTALTYVQKLKYLVEDPQHAMPDVFVWLISGGKRTAYQRLPARDLIYSIVDEECGRDCGKVQMLLLKLPGKKGAGPSGWAIQAKLQMYMWLGLVKHKKHFVDGLPEGYELSPEIRNAERPRALPPSVIHYVEKHTFQLRAHMYQARSLIGSDASGLSDPFARVVVGEFCKATQVIDETLSPTWDELLVFDGILVYGTARQIKAEPPDIVVEIFDQDKVGKSEFIGRAIAKPRVKLLGEPYGRPEFPPALEWHEIARGPDRAGELLAAFELLQLASTADSDLPALPEAKATAEAQDQDTGPILPVPRGIRPTLAKYRIEVLFWGLRDLKRVHLLTVDKPRVDIECAGHILHSSVIQNARKNPNFNNPVKFLELELPEQELYRPPLTVRVVDCRSFGRYTLVGTHTISSIHKYMYVPATKRERDAEERKRSLLQLQHVDPNNPNQLSTSTYNVVDSDKEISPLLPKDTPITLSYGTRQTTRKEIKTEVNKKRKQSLTEEVEDESNRDWWTKYFASIEAMIEENKEARKETAQTRSQQNGVLPTRPEDGSPREPRRELSWTSDRSERRKVTLKGAAAAAKIVARLSPKSVRRKRELGNATMKIYSGELEMQPEYNGFKEWLLTFDLYRGKKTGDDAEDDSRVVGAFKGAIKVYKWPLPKDMEDHTIMGLDPQYGFFQGLPSNDPIHVLVRVYVVKASDLHPMDLNGKADPYVVLQLGSKRVSDKDSYISKQLNPVFGKCFEIEATFPQDSMLTVQVLDWDLVGADDMIGETRIDLENRFYSRHRATCGIARKYEDSGYNRWRDPMKPTQILAKLCKDGKMDAPTYTNGKVKLGRHTFYLQSDEAECSINTKGLEEHMALAVLYRWHEFPRVGCRLVPEHVETRPLYNPDKPGIEQGKLEMWVDMFPMDMPLPGPPVDVSPRKPRSYELRVVVWNTDDVVLEDDAFFTGEKMSDIYVKGWLKGPEDCQCTDIHYRSLTGEGNFNWRFVYPFDYLVAEEKIVISKKESLFSWDETESKIPARLELQVWDADHFSADDFLGAITLDLNRFPRGAKSSKLCTLDMLKTDGSVPMVNIFKQKRVKGWWPFYVKKENEEMELTGKVEAEIHLLSKEEAEKNPAGLGRNEPDALDKPNRPDASFMWFLNPLKSIRYIVWHNYKWAILKILIALALAIVLLLFFYSVPGYTVKKIIGA